MCWRMNGRQCGPNSKVVCWTETPTDEYSSAACEKYGMPQTDFLWDNQHSNRSDTVLQQTRSWVEQFIAGFVCPFVKDSDQAGRGQVSYHVSTAANLVDAGVEYWRAAKAFRADENIASMLIIFPQFSQDFVRFQLWGNNMGGLQQSSNEMELKRTLFHPLKVFDINTQQEGKKSQLGCVDCLDYLHRSPYPTVVSVQKGKANKTTAQWTEEDSELWSMNKELTDFKLALVGKAKLQSMLDAKDWEDMDGVEQEFHDMYSVHARMRAELFENWRKRNTEAEQK